MSQFRCQIWPDDNYDRRAGAIVIGHIPAVLITTRRRRGMRNVPEPVIYRAYVPYQQVPEFRATAVTARVVREQGRICNMISRFYICYVISIRYCARSKASRNLWYELRVCREVTVRDLERISARCISANRSYVENRRAVMDAIWKYINAIASGVVDNVWQIFNRLVARDAGGHFVDSAEIIDAIQVLVPRIYDRDTGMPLYCSEQTGYMPRDRIREVPIPPNELSFIYRCRCGHIHEKEDIARTRSVTRGQLSLLQFMPLEQLASLYENYVYGAITGVVEQPGAPPRLLERTLYESLLAARERYDCVDMSREREWRSAELPELNEPFNFFDFVKTREFERQTLRYCTGRTRLC